MRAYRVSFVSPIVFLLTACSANNSNSSSTAPAPVFTSTPITQAVEGSPYSYQLAASGTAVTFSLSSAPSGATLSGNTVSWTPTTQESRTANSFTVTATASGGASSTQAWAVTPSGTVRISYVNTVWNQTGSTAQPFNWSPVSSSVAALVPQADGSFQTLSGAAGSDGTFDIPNVPAGYYWLRISSRDTYWTSSSTFDVGTDVFEPTTAPILPSFLTTNISFNITSLDPTIDPGLFAFEPLDYPVAYAGSTNPGSTTFAGGFQINGDVDYSVMNTGFIREYEPAAFGSMKGYVLGPSLTLSNLSLTTGSQNTISGALNPTVPSSIDLSVKGSAWPSLFDHIAPTAATAFGGVFDLFVEPYVSSGAPNLGFLYPIDLIWTTGTQPTAVGSLLYAPTCSESSPISFPPLANLPLTSDVEAGTVQYSDPFPSTWRRIFRVCESASVPSQLPGVTQNVTLTNTQMTSVPVGTVTPLISAVQNPKVNGADLFTATTIKGTGVTLSWDPPAIGRPIGYSVQILSPTTLPPNGSTVLFAGATLSTVKTSMIVPPGLLQSGQTYVFVITSLVDGKANMETSPHRSSLPTASAQLVSAPVTITNEGMMWMWVRGA